MVTKQQFCRLDRLIGLGMACVMAIGLAMAYHAPASAQWDRLPTAGQGQLPPNDAPCRLFHVGQSSGTGAIVLTSVPSYVSWLMMSTATADASRYVTIRDTASVNGVVDRLRLYHASTVQNTYLSFQPPFALQTGLQAEKANSADWVTFCARPINSQFP